LRIVVFTVALAFVAGLAALTVSDFARNGVTALGVISALIVVLFMVGIIGALRQPPRQ
jgi:hypothetical protein